MRKLETKFYLLFLPLVLGGVSASAESPLHKLQALTAAALAAGNPYQAGVQQGVANAPPGVSASEAVRLGAMVSSSQAQTNLDQSTLFFSTAASSVSSAASAFWHSAANATQAALDQSVAALAPGQAGELAKAAPVGNADAVAHPDGTFSNTRDMGAKSLQAAANANEAATAETARFWGMMGGLVNKLTQEAADAGPLGLGVGSSCPPRGVPNMSCDAVEMRDNAMDVGQVVKEFIEVRDLNLANVAASGNGAARSNAAALLGSSPATGIANVPPNVASALASAGLDANQVIASLSHGDPTAFGDVVDSLLGAVAVSDQTKDVAGNGDVANAADLAPDVARNGSDVSDRSDSTTRSAAAMRTPASNAAMSPALRARLAGSQLPGTKSRGANVSNEATKEALRRSYLRKHGEMGEPAGDTSSVSRSFAMKKLGSVGPLSDETIYDLRRVGVQKRRDRATIFQVARLTYHKEATSNGMHKHAAAKSATAPWLLAGSVTH